MSRKSFDVFLILDPFEDRWQESSRRLPVWKGERRFVASIDGYYSPERDAAMVGLRFHPALASGLGAGGIEAMLKPCGKPLVIIDTLAPGEIDSFWRRLARYPVFVQIEPEEAPTRSALDRIARELIERADDREIALANTLMQQTAAFALGSRTIDTQAITQAGPLLAPVTRELETETFIPAAVREWGEDPDTLVECVIFVDDF